MNDTDDKKGGWGLISLLGALSVVSPFSIDMYLPAFSQIAREFGTSSATVSFSVSSYFIGLALGQVVYGPLLDRFGRKRPLYIGLALFLGATVACAAAPDINSLILLRFLQAMGGCVAQVGAVTMVHDFFPAADRAKIFSLLFLFIGVSPLLAPSVGSLIMLAVGWRYVFGLLALIVAAILAIGWRMLPEGHMPDNSISLRVGPILSGFFGILRHPQFYTYALAGAFSFAGLFAYVAGSPIIFMEGFQLSPQAYGGVFALLTMGFIGGNQLNVLLLKRFSSAAIFRRAVIVQVAVGLGFFIGSCYGWYGLPATLGLFFMFLSCAGLTYPNAAAMALQPFDKNAGSASALMGFLQLGVGAVISTGIGFSAAKDSLPIIGILALTAMLALFSLIIGQRQLTKPMSA